ncbi:MAG TPA: iron-sulfur cluster assembly accessory protein, partial [Sphingomicrobium sp.]
MNKETKVRARPAAIILTSAAEERIADLMSRAPEGAIGVKLSTPRRGCSGLAYSVDYVTEANPMDEKIETPGGTFYVDGGSILYLIGSVMDWRED